MGMLGSPIEKIRGFHFSPFPANRLVAPKLVIAVGCHVYAIGAKGTLYTTGEMAGKVCYCGTGSDYHAVMALLAFGMITPKEAYVHGEEKRKRDKAFTAYRALTCETEKLTDAGITLTAGQKAKLEKLRKGLKVKDLPYFVQGEAARKLGRKT